MVKHLIKQLANPRLQLWAAIGGFVLVTLAPTFHFQHVLLNIEPYPDGLMYVLPALNVARWQGMQLTFRDVTQQPNVPPFYSLVLAIGYSAADAPALFYVVNMMLGVATVWSLVKVLQLVVRFTALRWVLIGLWLAQPYLWWLPSLPMAENVLLALVSALVLLVVEQRWTKARLVLVVFLATAVFLSKYQAAPVALVLGMWVWWSLWRRRQITELVWLCSWGLVAALTAGLLLVWRGFNPAAFLAVKIPTATTNVPAVVSFSSQYFWPQLMTYAQSLIGRGPGWLWQPWPLLSGMTGLSAVVAALALARSQLVHAKMRPHARLVWWLSISLFIAAVSLSLFFYAADARYVLVWLVAVWLLLVGAAAQYGGHKPVRWFMVALGLLCMVGQMVTFRHLAKEVLVANWLGRSVAWQYQGVMVIDKWMRSHPDDVMVTALPPFLFEAYVQPQYQLAPLSSVQEFAQKKQNVWGGEASWLQMPITAPELLAKYPRVYVSAAYITHQQQVIKDFEYLKQHYVMREVAPGCLGTCSIFELVLRNEGADSQSQPLSK